MCCYERPSTFLDTGYDWRLKQQMVQHKRYTNPHINRSCRSQGPVKFEVQETYRIARCDTTQYTIKNDTKRYNRVNLTKSYFTYEPLTKSRVNQKLFFFCFFLLLLLLLLLFFFFLMGSKETGVNLTELSIKNSYHLSGIVTHSAS